jgi:hypothetical protein
MSQLSYGVYLEDLGTSTQRQPFPTKSTFSRLGATTALSSIGSFHPEEESVSKNWSLALDWALVWMYDRQYKKSNQIPTQNGTLNLSLVVKKHDLKKAKVIVAGGISDIIYTQVQSTTAEILLPWSNEMQEVWKIDYLCGKLLAHISCHCHFLTLHSPRGLRILGCLSR